MLSSKLYVTTYFENVATYFLCLSYHLLKCLSQHKKPLSRPTCLNLSHYSAILCRGIFLFYLDILSFFFNSLCHDIVVKCRDSSLLPFAWNNVTTEQRNDTTKFCLLIPTMSQLSLSLLQHLSFSSSHIMSRQSCEMS